MQADYIDLGPNNWVHHAEEAWLAVRRHFRTIDEGLGGELHAHSEPITWNREETEASVRVLGKHLVFHLKLVLSRSSRAYVGICEVFEVRKLRDIEQLVKLGPFMIGADGQTNLGDAEHTQTYAFPAIAPHIISHYLRKTIEVIE